MANNIGLRYTPFENAANDVKFSLERLEGLITSEIESLEKRVELNDLNHERLLRLHENLYNVRQAQYEFHK